MESIDEGMLLFFASLAVIVGVSTLIAGTLEAIALRAARSRRIVNWLRAHRGGC